MSEPVWPFVGREEPLRRAAAAVSGTRCRGALLVGDAGVGKSRIAHETLRSLADSGRATAWLAATGGPGGIPLGALASLLPLPGTSTPASNMGVGEGEGEGVATLPHSVARSAHAPRAARSCSGWTTPTCSMRPAHRRCTSSP